MAVIVGFWDATMPLPPKTDPPKMGGTPNVTNGKSGPNWVQFCPPSVLEFTAFVPRNSRDSFTSSGESCGDGSAASAGYTFTAIGLTSPFVLVVQVAPPSTDRWKSPPAFTSYADWLLTR